jgi:hypothetical protein
MHAKKKMDAMHEGVVLKLKPNVEMSPTPVGNSIALDNIHNINNFN